MYKSAKALGKRIFQTIISFCLIIIMCLIPSFSAPAGASDNAADVPAMEAWEYSEKYNAEYARLMAYWGEYPDYYAGAYIDGAEFCVMVTCKPAKVQELIWQITGDGGVNVIQAEYSYKYLEEVNERISDIIIEETSYGNERINPISGWGIDERRNNITLDIACSEENFDAEYMLDKLGYGGDIIAFAYNCGENKTSSSAGLQ